jgi:lipopolysaccharide/colanic/teichoic acid biosynthesis glycosyltransferase
MRDPQTLLDSSAAAAVPVLEGPCLEPRVLRFPTSTGVSFSFEEAARDGVAWRVKRAIDILIAASVLLVLSPALVAVALLVRITDPGPIFHRRRVVGRGGVAFDAFKFRTMRVDADRVLQADNALWDKFKTNFKLPDDPRITGIGRVLRRYSLDEIPQLLNVLRGEMSVVGPRMITETELERYGHHAARLVTVRPGITGLWQVSGRQLTTYERRVELDMHYIDDWSLALDLKILARTPLVVLRADGAY